MLNTLPKTLVLVGIVLSLLSGCTSAPGSYRDNDPTHAQAAQIARSMVGKPYRYGGNSPQGFDCSGLVHYSYVKVGKTVPRTTYSQRKEGLLVSPKKLQKGDLVFFDQDGKKSSHVGIYLGDGYFVHAPSSGKQVRTDNIRNAYWQKHFREARRFPSL